MGTLTYTELTTELRAALGNNRSSMESRLKTFLNLAQMRIARKFDWSELQQVQEGTLGYTGDPTIDKYMSVPTNLRSIYSFRLTDSNYKNPRRLEYVQQNVWDETIPDTEFYSVSYPSHYTIWKGRIELWRIPDAAYPYAIRHSSWPTAFDGVNMSQISDLEHKDDAIISLAASWAFLTLREMDEANRWWGVYKDMINDATSQDTEKPALDIVPAFEQLSDGLHGSNYWQNPFIKGNI